MSIVLGIDPGSRVTGYGVIRAQGNRLEYIGCGCIKTQAATQPQRLKQIFDELSLIIQNFAPEQVAIEEVFMGKNAASALKLGQARGAAMTACLAFDLPIEEYSSRKVKKALVGRGAAEKAQVQHMVSALLSIAEPIAEDAADALAIAVCHANTQASLIRMAGAGSVRRRSL